MTKAPKAAPAPAGALSTDDLALAAQHVELLREIHAGDHATKTDLAKHLGRDLSNLNKTLKILAEAGLAHAEGIGGGLPDKGQRALKAIDKAAGAASDEPGSSQGGIVFLYWSQIAPDPQNARRDWDSAEAIEELKALRDDILANDLLQNLVVRGPGHFDPIVKAVDGQGQELPLYTLIGGERRWRAIGMALKAGDWAEDRLIPCRLLETDDLGHKLAGLAENLQRRNLNPIEKANAFEGLSAHLSNAEIAEKVGCTAEHVQQHRRFLKLSAADQQRMTLPRDDDNHLSVREARRRLANMPQPPELTPEERLLFAEVAYRVYSEKKDRWARVEINPAPADDPTVKSLQSRSILVVSDSPKWDDARFYAGINYSGQSVAEVTFPWLTEKANKRREGLTDLQREILGADAPVEGGFATPWLNGPFELSAEGQALIDRRAQQEADAERARELQAQRSEEKRQKLAAARIATSELVERVVAIGDAPPPIDPEFESVVTGLNHPLPWSSNDRGEVLDAQGATVFRVGDYYGAVSDRELALAVVVSLAANSAGGVPMPPPPAAPERSVFEAAMVGRLRVVLPDLSEEEAATRATEILDQLLEENAVAFGVDDWDWSVNGAIELVNDHLEIDEAA